MNIYNLPFSNYENYFWTIPFALIGLYTLFLSIQTKEVGKAITCLFATIALCSIIISNELTWDHFEGSKLDETRIYDDYYFSSKTNWIIKKTITITNKTIEKTETTDSGVRLTSFIEVPKESVVFERVSKVTCVTSDSYNECLSKLKAIDISLLEKKSVQSIVLNK